MRVVLAIALILKYLEKFRENLKNNYIVVAVFNGVIVSNVQDISYMMKNQPAKKIIRSLKYTNAFKSNYPRKQLHLLLSIIK